MHVSTKGRYGLRVMLDLAHQNGARPATLKGIAARQDLSEKYLWQVIRPLAAAGLITSVRGAHGGYRLARPTTEITLKDIYFALEGPCELVPCAESPKHCRRDGACASQGVWKDLQDLIVAQMRSQTLQAMVERYDAQHSRCTYEI
ncbi:MAG: Rrf2 family transcriptional regulator [Kiritimatiellaeota bacterium]|nr:Rrf2 family transcriptional regulator [Kiritimatiellota bacterium]